MHDGIDIQQLSSGRTLVLLYIFATQIHALLSGMYNLPGIVDPISEDTAFLLFVVQACLATPEASAPSNRNAIRWGAVPKHLHHLELNVFALLSSKWAQRTTTRSSAFPTGSASSVSTPYGRSAVL